MYGPFVYCFEGVDNGGGIPALRVPRAAPITPEAITDGPLAGMTALTLPGVRAQSDGELYAEAPPAAVPAPLRAIPYFAWGNRGENQMRVWMTEGDM